MWKSQTKERKRRDQKIKLVEETKNNIWRPNFEALLVALHC